MSDDELNMISDPKIRSLCELLEKMPEYLAEQRRKAAERERFVRSIWEKAIRDAGLIDRKFY
jgi:hypothetical protein